VATDADVWEDTIERLFKQLSEVPTCWEDRQREMVDPEALALCMLRVSSVLALGVDETRHTFTGAAAPDPDTFPAQTGNRRPVLTVTVDSWDNDAKRRARHILERIRTRLRRPSSRALLNDIDTSLSGITAIVATGRIEDNREYARASMDVMLNTIVDDPDHAFGSIKNIEVSGTIKDVDDSVVANPAFTIVLPDP
jgi:hypothetical protein